jgi:hypothetical protein
MNDILDNFLHADPATRYAIARNHFDLDLANCEKVTDVCDAV